VTLVGPAYWVSVVVSVALHESAHLAMAYLGGVRVKHVGLSWKGPYIVREPGTPLQNTFISLAGPGINLFLCVLCWHLSGTFAFVNGLLAGINLLPIRSSDGLRVYRIWCARSNQRRTEFSRSQPT
jgi:Zn-dependent protease